jgi:GH35 family endo-1,4-beta-xylanase
MVSKDDGNNPYFRNDPGVSLQRIPVHRFDIENNFSGWKLWRTNDGRVLPNPNSHFELMSNPFEIGSLILLTTCFDPDLAGKSFGGFGMRAPIDPPIKIDNQTYIEFDLYYPKSASGKYMRFEIWSTSSSGEGIQSIAGLPGTVKTQVYLRDSDLTGLKVIQPDWIGFYNRETWYKKTVCAVTPVSSGIWEYLNIDLHTENNTKLNGDQLMIGNIRITQIYPNQDRIPDVVNTKSFLEVEPLKGKYNLNNGNFLVGVIGAGPVEPDSIRGYHYEIFVGENSLKPEYHINPPFWLKDEFPKFKFKVDNSIANGDESEWKLQTERYLSIRDSGKPDEYKMHGHCLAWIYQSPPWMRQLIPENIASRQWNKNGLFFSGSSNSTGPYLKINKAVARRVYFNHILYTMRHFMSTSQRYDSDAQRGIIPFHSFDVINVEIHESRYLEINKKYPNEWKTALKNASWLMAMTDTDYSDINNHYIYLLFKYAHIAIPNAQMAEKFKAHYNDDNIVPAYMKMDAHDDNGSIDAYITEKPPILTYNEYELNFLSKAKIAYNMINELNTVWKNDPLYDGRNLIECIGIQTHNFVTPVTSSHNQQSLLLFTGLIDKGLLDCVSYSEIDIRQHSTAPGGEALAPAVLNQKQADAIGYQYALLFKLFDKYKKYIDHVIIWAQYGVSNFNSYVLFDHEKMASQAYYAVMDPDKFIKGHSYLDEFFEGEYEKLISDYKQEN